MAYSISLRMPQVVCHGVEKHVAGVLYGLGDVVIAVGELAVGLGVYPAGRGVALVGVLGEEAGALYLGLGVDYVLREARDGGAGLEGGARLIGAVERAVEERVILGLQQVAVILYDAREVEGRVARDGEGLAVLTSTTTMAPPWMSSLTSSSLPSMVYLALSSSRLSCSS